MDSSILVRFRFDGEKKHYVGRLTYTQYLNLKELPITKVCKIVHDADNTLSEEEMVIISAKIRKATSKGHTSKLSKN